MNRIEIQGITVHILFTLASKPSINYVVSILALCIFSLFSLSILLLFILIIAIAGTWILAAIYVKHHETSSWQYAFAGACGFQVIFQ